MREQFLLIQIAKNFVFNMLSNRMGFKPRKEPLLNASRRASLVVIVVLGVPGLACAPPTSEGQVEATSTSAAIGAAPPRSAAAGRSAPVPVRREVLTPAPPRLADVQGRVSQETYRVETRQGTLRAENPRQNLVSTFGEQGWTLVPRVNEAARVALARLDPRDPDHDRRQQALLAPAARPDWSVGIRFAGLGRSGRFTPSAAAVAPVLGACDATGRTGALGQCCRRVEYRYPGVTEYLANDARGVEHGYVVDRRPDGAGDLVVSARVTGLEARATADGQAVILASGGIDRVRYADLAVVDARGQRLAARLAVARDWIDVVVDDRNAEYPVHIDPLATTATPVLSGENQGDRFGYSVASAGDVNGDGHADVLVGAWGWSGARGKAYLFLGSATGLATTAAWSVEGEAANDQLGSSVAAAGDVNGDGFGDVVVGAPYNSTSTGKAYLFLGSASGLATTPSWTASGSAANSAFGYSVAAAGDVNGDGLGDVIVGAWQTSSNAGAAYVFLGTATGLAPTAAWTRNGEAGTGRFGYSVAAAGDVNGDGFGDVIVGAGWFNSIRGKAYVFLGTATGLDTAAAWTTTGSATNSYLGVNVASAGDVNGDGYADVLVGAFGVSSSQGQAYLHLGSPTGPSPTATWTASGETTGSRFGNWVASAGDVNGDGFADVLVGAPGHASDTGRAYLYLGSAASLDATATWTVSGETTGEYLGAAVVSAGDVDGDGFSDVVVGARVYDSYRGRVYLYHGSGAGLAASGWMVTSTDSGFGGGVASAGDVNGDGYADVIVGAGGADRAYVYLGSATGLSTTASVTLSGSSSFGNRVASAGDVNGDGYADVIVGAFSSNRAHVYLGSATGLSTTASVTLTGSGYFGSSVASAGDVNGDGFADVVVGAVNGNAAYLYLGSVAGVSTTADATLTGANNFGAIVASAGDVNGDGFADVLVNETNGGRVHLYLGSIHGLGATPAVTLVGSMPFGRGVASAGDVNGDGYADVIVGDPASGGPGRVFLYLGSAAGLGTTPTASVTGPVQYFGTTVASAGDVNGDGYADVVISTLNQGSAFVYLGSAAPSLTLGWSATGTTFFGDRSVASAGDVNGDGFADILVGEYDSRQAHAYYGNERTSMVTARGLVPRQRLRPAAAPERPLHPQNLVPDGGAPRIELLARSSRGRTRVKLEWELKAGSAPFDGTGRQRSATWVDTGTPGSETWISEPITGLVAGSRYHWRARLLYLDGGTSPWMTLDRGPGVMTPDFRMWDEDYGASGMACEFATQCLSGSCQDGVCCDAACTADCLACVAHKTGELDGTCAPVLAGLDPDGECADGAACGDQGGTPACLCPAGTYGDGKTCTACPTGTFSTIVGATDVATCQACPFGTFNPLTGADSSEACLDCGPGTAAATAGSASCTACTAGTFQDRSGQMTCLLCPAGEHAPVPGMTECLPCAAGSVAAAPGSATCKVCPAGQAQPATGQVSCLDCAPGTFAVTSGQATCQPCAAGTFGASPGQTTCTACAAGTSQALPGQTSCTLCAPGQYNPSPGQATCLACAAGTYSATPGQTGCTACAAGTVQPDPGRTACVDCAVGTYSPTPGQAVCLACGPGSVAASPGSASCTACAAGTFQALPGQGACVDCDIGHYSATAGQTACVPCGQGTFAASPRSTACTVCVPGTVQPLTGGDRCLTCGVGYYSPTAGQAVCLACAPGSVAAMPGSTACTVCTAGTFQSFARDSCLPCLAGTYSASAGSTVCTPCAQGSFAATDRATTCTLCAAGTVQPAQGQPACMDCAVGTYSPTAGQATCLACGPGSVAAAPGSAACTACETGTYQALSGQGACVDCAAGHFSAATGQATCTPCDRGTHAAGPRSTACTACAAGTFQAQLGQTQCLACDAGTYSPTSGQAACLACTPGSMAAAPGSTACTACAAGTYQAQAGQGACLDCAAGFYSASAGSTLCSPCDPGSVAAAPRSATCAACAAGTFQDQPGQIACLDCAAGTYGPAEGQAMCLSCDVGWTSATRETACHEICGDGLRVGAESCDDHNQAPGDGCSDLCQVEEGWLCPRPGEACRAGCEIDGALYTADAPNPANACEACRPALSQDAWSPREVGTPCADDGLACTGDRCDGAGACLHPVVSGCLIEDACVSADATDPANACAACLPALRTDDYSPRAAGVACPDDGLAYTQDACDGAGQCTHSNRLTCVIDGTELAGGTPDPANPCQACDPAVSQEAWTPRADGYPCADDDLACTWDVCDGAGQCTHRLYTGCLVAGACVADRDLDPANPCQECHPTLATDAYSPRAAGVSCPDDGLGHTLDVCDAAGACVHPATGTCTIDATVIEGGAPNPANPCQVCDPEAAPTAWSDRALGYPCLDDGLACTWDRCDGAGQCEHRLTTGCLVDGACLGYGALDPENACLACDPAQDATGFSPRPEGVACGEDGLPHTADTCDGAGQCQHEATGACVIDGTRYGGGAANPANPCQACDPVADPAAWTSRVAGYPCPDDGLTCTADTCDGAGVCAHPLATGCLVEGACVALHALDPGDACRWCDPTVATDGYSPRDGCGGTPDAGTPDSGTPDGGAGLDAATGPDASDATDIGRCGPGTRLVDGFCVPDGTVSADGCDCRAAGEGPGDWSFALLWCALALLALRRARRRA
jgi:cysteine-rich repeat protein